MWPTATSSSIPNRPKSLPTSPGSATGNDRIRARYTPDAIHRARARQGAAASDIMACDSLLSQGPLHNDNHTGRRTLRPEGRQCLFRLNRHLFRIALDEEQG